jgi:Flp pilus assembly protein TadG
MRRLRHGQRGATVLEFALVLPVFLAFAGLVLFGAWLGVVKTILDHGAREGARYAALPSSADLRSYPSAGEVLARVNDTTPMLDPSKVTVTPGAGGNARSAPFSVQVEYRVTNPFRVLFAPLRIFGWDGPAETLTVTAEAEARRE